MGKAIFDILRENGANWVNDSGDFTKRVTSDKVQVFLSLSPSGYILVAYFELPFGNYFEWLELPTGIKIPEDVTHDDIVAKLQLTYPTLKSEDVFEIRNAWKERIAVTLIPSSRALAVYGIVDGKDYFTRTSFTHSLNV